MQFEILKIVRHVKFRIQLEDSQEIENNFFAKCERLKSLRSNASYS